MSVKPPFRITFVELVVLSLFRWLDRVIQRIIYQAKASVKNASRNRSQLYEKTRKIDQFLEAFEKKQMEAVAGLHQFQRTLEHGALQKLSAYLSSEEVKARFTSWTLDEVPESEGNWDDTVQEIKNPLSKRLREFMQQWEEDNKVFANAYKSLVEHVQSFFSFFEGQLRNVEMLRNEYVAETRSQKDMSHRYQPIIDEGSHLRGRLAEYGFKEVRATDISTDNLNWKEDTSSRLGCGAFGVVYKGNMKRNEDVYTVVALKMYNDVLDAKNNASLFMSEVQILR